MFNIIILYHTFTHYYYCTITIVMVLELSVIQHVESTLIVNPIQVGDSPKVCEASAPFKVLDLP